MKRGLWCISMLFGLTSMVHAFIYEARVLRQWNAADNQYHYFIGLSDFHDRTHKVTQPQRDFLEQAFAKIDKEKTKIIVEDLSSPGVGGRASCGRFFLGPKGGILSGLGKFCTQCALDVENVEYRYCRVVALGPVMDRIRNECTLCCDASLVSTRTTMVEMLMHEVNDLMREIAAYDDGALANNYYIQCVADINARYKELQLEQFSALSAADYAQSQLSGTDREEKLKHIFTFDSGLLDAKMLHTVLAAKNKATIVAVAGGTHIGVVSDLLENIGYEVVYTASSAGITHGSTVGSCLEAQSIQKQVSNRPEPIDITMVGSYL